jgi:cytochrome c oxidase subunit 2
MGSPLNYFFHSAGPATAPTLVLGWVFTAICCAVCLVVLVLLAIALWRRRPPLAPGALLAGRGGLQWVYAGTALSTLILFGMAVYALVVLQQLSAAPAGAALRIQVTGWDWWWQVRYLEPSGQVAFETANEIHIPVGRPVLLELASADVIHAFWVPQLAGKTQMIPGTVNRQWLQADAPGIYRGQCTQYCGVQHAHMAFEVIAQAPQEYARWQSQQRQPAANALFAPGWKVFADRCAACHTIGGTPARGDHGPDLTHLSSRRQLAAGLLDNTQANRAEWIAHAQRLKPGSLMPDIALSDSERRDLLALLDQLD